MTAALCLVVIIFRDKKIRFIKNPKFFILGLLTIFFLSVYKEFYKAIKDKDWLYLKETLLNSSFYVFCNRKVHNNAIKNT